MVKNQKYLFFKTITSGILQTTLPTNFTLDIYISAYEAL